VLQASDTTAIGLVSAAMLVALALLPLLHAAANTNTATATATATAGAAAATAGKGTNAVDGAALVTALARHLAGEGQGTRCKALLTLHFLEVFKQGLIGVRSGATGRTDLPGISVFHMEVCVCVFNS
jgi:hypothetical protein